MKAQTCFLQWGAPTMHCQTLQNNHLCLGSHNSIRRGRNELSVIVTFMIHLSRDHHYNVQWSNLDMMSTTPKNRHQQIGNKHLKPLFLNYLPLVPLGLNTINILKKANAHHLFEAIDGLRPPGLLIFFCCIGCLFQGSTLNDCLIVTFPFILATVGMCVISFSRLPNAIHNW